MNQFTEEKLLTCMKSCESEFITLAEIHKLLIQNNILCSIDELRNKAIQLHRDGYLGNEPTVDGVNMYYIIFCPELTKENPLT